MNESPRRYLEPFDSKDATEIASANPAGEFDSPTLADQSHQFLGSDAGGDFNLETGLDTLGDTCNSNSEFEAVKLSNCTPHETCIRFKLNIHKNCSSVEPETKDPSDSLSTPQTSQIDHIPSGSPSSTESVAVGSEADECMNESPPSSPESDIAENGLFYSSLSGCGLNHCIGNSDMDDANMEVILHPDYVVYKDNYYTGLKLTFSQFCIQIDDSIACVKQEAFNIEWTVDDLVDIKCQLIQSSGMVIIKLSVKSSNAVQSNHVSCCTSGIEELKIAVVDTNWSLRQKQITSLNVKYAAVCNTVFNMDVEDNERFSLGPKYYFPNFQESFDEVVYPKGDPDAVSLSKRDVDLLQPDTYINDTVIDFYIQYLRNKIPEGEKPRFHFFNSFFFRKLADMDKNPSSASDGKAAFQRVRKWTRKVNLFEKDYIFIPVNFNLHWSLIVICHPGEVVSFNDEEPNKSLRVPCILHMDSVKGCHSGLKNLLQSYLWEEWKERQKDTCGEDRSSRFLNMRFLPVALPQQENAYDCGLFLLHYLELFLADAPVDFNPFKLTKFSNFLNLDWFPPAEAYLKRTLIQRLIFELVENHSSRERFSSDYSGDHHYSENNENRTGVRCPQINGQSPTSHCGQGIEITLLSASSSMGPQSFNTSGIVLKELFEPEATAGTSTGHCQSLDRRSADQHLNGSVFSVEEDTDLSEQLMYITTDPNFQHVAGIPPQSLSYSHKGCGQEISHRPNFSLPAEHHVKAESSVDTSSCSSDDSDDIGIIEYYPNSNGARSSHEDEGVEKNSTSIENLDPLSVITDSATINLPNDSLMEISQHSNAMCGDDKNGDQYWPHQETPIQLHQVSDAVDDKVTPDGVQMIDDMEPDNGEEQYSNVTSADDKNGDQYWPRQEAPPIQLHQVSDAADDKVTPDGVQMIDDMEADDGEEQYSNVTCADDKNGDQYWPCQEAPPIQLHQVSDAVDDKVTPDGVLMIDYIEPDNCEGQAAKKRQIMSSEAEVMDC